MLGLEPGSLFAGRYEIIRSLGAGGMGAVYLACDPFDRDFLVAIKLLYPGALESPHARERFRNEITASYKINHPNVVKAYEYFDAEDMQAYAMEYVDGGDLMDRILNGPLSTDETIAIMKQLASALIAIHNAGIVHRDLKPENILMTKRGEVKISDFGVARLRSTQNITHADSMVGTPKYLAPEYIETGECDKRGDIYAVGVMAYEMISGQSPFGKDFKPDQIIDRLTLRIPPLNEIAPTCPALLGQVIEKAMSMRLSKRYSQAEDLLSDLEAIENSLLDNPHQETEVSNPHIDVISKQNFSSPTPLIEEPISAAETEYANKPSFNFNYSEDALLNKHRPTITVAAALITLILVIGVVARTTLVHKISPTSLPDGQYTGITMGALGVNSKYPIAVLRRGESTWFMLGKFACPMSKLKADSTFNCGELVFKVTFSTVTGTNAIGTISETSWGSEGTWNISKATNAGGTP